MCCLAKQKSDKADLSNLYPSVERKLLSDKKFDLSTQSRVLRLYVMTKYVLIWCFLFHSLLFDLQHDYFQLKKS